MSYQEKNITVSLMSYLLILGFYLLNLVPMVQGAGLASGPVFSLWVTVIVAGIVVNIIASVLTTIGFSIVHVVKTKSNKSEPLIADERDKLISLKGYKNSYITFSIGVGLAMLTLVFNNPPLVMFSLLVLSGLVAEIVGDVSQIYLYRRGV